MGIFKKKALRNKIRVILRRMSGEFGYDNGMPFVRFGSTSRLYLAHRKRFSLYFKGVDSRIDQLTNDYRLPAGLLRQGDTVIEIGANIGEIGVFAQSAGAHYIGFEPDPKAFSALKRNLPNQTVFDIAVSDKDSVLSFYLATQDADSSLFKPSSKSSEIKVQVRTLDGVLSEISRLETIRLLKVEAEGMEPEVLKGAAEVLKGTEFVAIDAGPERGGENTVPECLNILFAAGFKIDGCFLQRGTFLLSRR
jgi:FkbM family methyltransferase